MKLGKASMVIGVILAIALLAAGCARATPTPRATPAPTPAPAATPTPTLATVVSTPTPTPVATTPAPTPVAKPKAEGVLRIGRSSWTADVFDPRGAAAIVNQLSMIYDGLVGELRDSSDISPDTGLAYKWEQSPGGLTWTFYLRKGVMFDKGWGEATAEDVKFSLERVMREGTMAPFAGTLKQRIKTIEVVDPYTVRFQFNMPAITLPYDLSFIYSGEGTIVPKKYIEKVGDNEFAANPIGSGPYRLVKVEPGLYWKFEAREDYWAGVPRFREVYLFTIPEEGTRLAMLKRGELDIAEVSMDRLKEMGEAGFKVFEKAGTNEMTGYIENQWSGFNADAKVRQAMNLAVNKKEMLDSLFQGRGRVLPGTVLTWALGFKPFAPYPYDPKRAKELLAEAGYPKGFALQLVTSPKDPEPMVTQALAGYLEAIGIKTKITSMDKGATTEALARFEFANTVYVSGLVNRPFTAGFWRARAHSKGYITFVRDPKLDALIEGIEQAKDLNELATYQGKVQQYAYESFTILPLVEVGDYYAVSPKLALQTWAAGGKSRNGTGLMELVMRR